MADARRISADSLVAMVIAAGACAAGVVPCSKVPGAETELFQDWLRRGCHGDMAYLQRNAPLAASPHTLLEDARTLISCAFPYGPDGEADRHPLFADYARGADYHKALRKRLRPVCRILEETVPGSRTRICVDSAPVRERYWAVAAGLGHVGLNGQLIVPGVGSKVFLAEILWTGEPDSYAAHVNGNTGCINCGACLRACPAGALDGKGGVDARKCLSYLTIEYRGDDKLNIPRGLRIYGCDICQDVCPENRQPAGPLPEFRLRPQLNDFDRAAIAALSPENYDLLTAGSAIRRLPLERLKANAAFDI